MTQASTPSAPSQFALSGAIDATNFKTWQDQGERHIQESAQPIVQIDLAGLERSNSMAVALLLAWLRCADSQGKALQIAQVPQSLRYIIDFSGLTEVLSI